jgi:UDP-N-acetyl-D-mannosaminuronate dehydrogenase
MGKIVAASKIAVLGASYRQDVGDTRYSGSEIIVRKLTEMGGEVLVHDPYVNHWWEIEKQDTYPSPNRSISRFFRNQERLNALIIHNEIEQTLKNADAVVFAVNHLEYKRINPQEVIQMVGRPAAVVDCFGMIDDKKIKTYVELGCEFKGMGRGHIKRLKDEVNSKK